MLTISRLGRLALFGVLIVAGCGQEPPVKVATDPADAPTGPDAKAAPAKGTTPAAGIPRSTGRE